MNTVNCTANRHFELNKQLGGIEKKSIISNNA